MPLYAGLDRSGTSDLTGIARGHDPYVVCVAAIETKDGGQEALHTYFSEVRGTFGMAAAQEFHGHEMSEAMMSAVLETDAIGELRVGALLIDKAATQRFRGIAALPRPPEVQAVAAQVLLERFLARCPLVGLWCDEDIKGKEKQQAFTSAVQRIHRTAWPGTQLKVRHKSSKSTDLIQLADVIAYGLANLARGTIKTSELRQRLVVIRDSTKNVIIGPVAWEEW